ncbi:PBP GOBP domain containing protein [Asbolus verrucosus]|uniref:PBP GOBP domain containing protein n=1 Tax=Asbolus verrucosus TaxID=1661398 RepID=A0A482W5R8_ASBVE|nr:PBP GOBP domain containing protein [Asbolus verrucosus]
MDENFAEAREECLKANSLTVEDLHSSWKSKNISEQHLCFRKCIMQKKGLLDESGAIQEEKVGDILNIRFDEEKRNALVECITEIGKIETCQDMDKVSQCFSKVRKI